MSVEHCHRAQEGCMVSFEKNDIIKNIVEALEKEVG